MAGKHTPQIAGEETGMAMCVLGLRCVNSIALSSKRTKERQCPRSSEHLSSELGLSEPLARERGVKFQEG